MTLSALLFIATALTPASAERSISSRKELERDRELLHPLNHSLAQALVESQEAARDPISATVAAVSLAFDIYEAYSKTKDAMASYNERKDAVDRIVKGHTEDVAVIVRAAHTELGEMEVGPKELQNVLDGDTFITFKGLLSTFEMAQRMCVHENEFFKDPVAWLMRGITNLGEKPTEEQVERMDDAKRLIGEVVKSLQGVIDEGVCPQLKQVVRTDLLEAQLRVEEWEKAVSEMAPISYYRMMYDRYSTEGNNIVSNTITDVGTKVMDKAAEYTSEFVQPDLHTCFNTATGQGIEHKGDAVHGHDKYEVDLSGVSDPRAMGEVLKNSSNAIHMALDRASMNMEMFDRECKRVAPRGREHIIEELGAEAKTGNEDAAKMFRAVSCDFCMRYGCREMAVLTVVQDVYSIVGYGIDKAILHLAKTFGPAWFEKILTTVSAVEDVVSPSGDKAVEFYCSLIFLLGKGAEQMRVGKTCIELGVVLERTPNMEKSDTLGQFAQNVEGLGVWSRV